MFAEYTKTRKDECLLSVLKPVNVNVCWVYWKYEKWMFTECTRTSKGESLVSALKLVKVNVCCVY